MSGLLGCWVVGLLGCWVVGLLGCWVVGLLGCWVVGLLGCWVVGLLGCWVVGLLGCWVVGRRRRRRHRRRRFCRCCCGVVGLLAECEFYVTSHEFLFLLTRCYHDMDRGPLNYLIFPSISTPGTFSTQILRLIIPHVE